MDAASFCIGFVIGQLVALLSAFFWTWVTIRYYQKRLKEKLDNWP